MWRPALQWISSVKTINFSNLETAIWVARLGGYTAAAEKLFTTQPAVSARIRELESGLGVKLFSRVGRGVELTLQGREFLERVEPLLAQLEELTLEMGAGGLTAGRVRVGAGNMSMFWFPLLVRQMQERLPGISYEVEIDLAGRLLDKVMSRKLDVAFVAGPVDEARFYRQSLGYDRVVWVTSRSYYSANQKRTLKDFLRESSLWCVQKDSFFWSEAMRTVVEQGADPRRFNAISNMAAARDMVLGDAGIGLVSESMVRQELQDGHVLCVPGLEQKGWVELSVVALLETAHTRPVADILQIAPQVSSLVKQPLDG